MCLTWLAEKVNKDLKFAVYEIFDLANHIFSQVDKSYSVLRLTEFFKQNVVVDGCKFHEDTAEGSHCALAV
jgi:hypothetical protein